MKIGGLGVPELLIILVIILLLFGGKKLPELGKSLGKTVKGLKEGLASGSDKKDNDNAEVVQTVEADNDNNNADVQTTSEESGDKKVVKKVVVKK